MAILMYMLSMYMSGNIDVDTKFSEGEFFCEIKVSPLGAISFC